MTVNDHETKQYGVLVFLILIFFYNKQIPLLTDLEQSYMVSAPPWERDAL